MADNTVTAASVTALTPNGAVVRDFLAGGSLNVGDAVYIDSSGNVQQADGSLAATAFGVGIVVSSYDGTTTIASGENVPVCMYGPVTGFSSATPGAKGWISDTAGKIATTSGTVAHELGFFVAADTFWVAPDPAGPGS